MTRTKKWDELVRTRCPVTRLRSRSWTSGPPVPPTRTYPPFKIYLTYYFTILNTFRFQKKKKKKKKKKHIDQWTTSHFQRTKLYFAFWRESSRNHFNCSMVLAAPLQHGAESTLAFGLLPSAAETTTCHQ